MTTYIDFCGGRFELCTYSDKQRVILGVRYRFNEAIALARKFKSTKIVLTQEAKNRSYK